MYQPYDGLIPRPRILQPLKGAIEPLMIMEVVMMMMVMILVLA
jgi:hypothetical protein